MPKCLLKALKAVDLQNHVELFLSLGYDSAGALAHFNQGDIQQLRLSEQESLRFYALLDVLKEATREGKICPHYSNCTVKSAPTRARSTEPSHSGNSQPMKTTYIHSKKQSNEHIPSKRSSSSIGLTGHSSSKVLTNKSHANGIILQRPSSSLTQQQKSNEQHCYGPRMFSNRPAVEHVKVKSYNYGVPTNKRQRNSSNRVRYQHEENFSHASVFVPSFHTTSDAMSYAKPAEIYVYARKRPLLASELNFHDIISVLDNKRIVIAEDKANLDCTPLVKRTEFQFDQVFGSDASNKQVFDCTVLPFLSSNPRHNLTYICFGQTGSGKSHTIFGSRNTDGLLIHCAQLLLQEMSSQNKLVCSFYEIYNNQVYDLTNTGKRLFVREDGEHRVNIVGVTEIALRTLDTLRSIIHDGLARRHHGKSAFNSNSSRSHAVFQILLKKSSNQAENFRLVFIDLAGSERATDAQNNQRQTRREGAQINSSLLALKECIRSMDMTHTHAPFRQSKLTHILRDSLVGANTLTCLMANVSPPNDCCQCSLNTLQYASRIRDISIRHRHRSVPLTNLQKQYTHDEQKQEHEIEIIPREKSTKTFKPATASTPVHRLISAVDHRTYLTTNQTGIPTRNRSSMQSLENDWQLADDDIPISGSGDNHIRSRAGLSSTRKFLLNTNAKNQNQSSSFYLTRYEQPQKKTSDHEGNNLSSYFPQPQADLNRPAINQPKQITNAQQWKTVPAPPVLPIRRLSNSSTEPPSSTRIIPIVSNQVSDDNQYSSATGTESLGTKITKLATGVRSYPKPQQPKALIENLNFNKHYDTLTSTTATTTVTTDAEQGLYSDRQATHRDQTGFFSNRDDPLYESIYRSNLTTITQRTSPATTPKNPSYHQKSDAISSSSKKSFSSPNKNHHRRPSTSSSSSLTSTDSEKNQYFSPKRQHRIVPYHVHHSSDSDDVPDHHHQQLQPASTHQESFQTSTTNQMMKKEQEQTDDQLLIEQFSASQSNNLLHAPLDQLKRLYDQTLASSFTSPVKDFGVNASEQLNNLRSLLETRLREDDDRHHPIKDSSILHSSPGTFAKDFLQSYKQSKRQNDSIELISDLDDDDDDDKNEGNLQKLNRNLSYQDQKKENDQNDVLSTSAASTDRSDQSQQQQSTLSDEVHSNAIPSTRTSTSASAIDTREPQFSSKLITDIYSHRLSVSDNDVMESASNPTSECERASDLSFRSPNRYTDPLSEGSNTPLNSQSRSPILKSTLRTSEVTNNYDHLTDIGKSSSLLTGTSFDALMNSLKIMREKDLDFLVNNNNDSLIRITD